MDTTGRDNTGLPDAGETGSDGKSRRSASSGPDLVRTSRLAVAACVLAMVSFLLLPGLIFSGGLPRPVRNVYPYIMLGASLFAVLLGLISLGRIGLSGGRLAGRGFACIGAGAPVIQGLVFLLVIVPFGPRSLAIRMRCGTNLSGIGKAMMLYANDCAGELPRAGGPNGTWGQMAAWAAPDRQRAFGLHVGGTGGTATMSSCFYLLVKYTEVTPKTFLCGSTRATREKGVSEFTLGDYCLPKSLTLADLWDFGPDPARHVSYAYQMVYSPYKLVLSAEPNMAIAADRNPWMDAPAVKARDFSRFTPDIPPFNGTYDQARQGNTSRHGSDGQNVLFLDTHVSFEKRPYCGLRDDNIYTSWDGTDKTRGMPPKLGSQPADEKDSLLVNDPPASRK